MNCTRCRKWVKRAALSSLGASRQAKLDAHLAECDGCRDSLESERRLLGAIGSGLAASVAGLPSSEFATRLRVRLAAEAPGAGEAPGDEPARLPAEWLRSPWIAASLAGLVALATLLAVTWLGHRRPAQPQLPRQIAQAAAPGKSGTNVSLPLATSDKAGVSAVTNPAREDALHVSPRPERARTHRSAPVEVQAPQFQVMVEPGQWHAILAAYRAAQSTGVDTNALAQISNQEEQPVKMKPIEIDPVVIAELYPDKSTVPAGR